MNKNEKACAAVWLTGFMQQCRVTEINISA